MVLRILILKAFRDKWFPEVLRKPSGQSPEVELRELAKIYEWRGVSKETALQVATKLTAHDALAAHPHDELGINEITQAKPLQAAMASFASFGLGALLPFVASLLAPIKQKVYFQYGFSIIFLMIL